MFLKPLVQWFQENILHHVFLQVGVIVLTYLFASFFAKKIEHYLEKNVKEAQAHMRLVLSPAQLAIVMKYVFWLVLVWFCQALFKQLEMSADVLHLALFFVAVCTVIRFASFYIKRQFWSRFVYLVCLVSISLRMFNLWKPTVSLLQSMTIGLGTISFSVWGLLEAVTVFIVLWAIADMANRLIAHWLITYTKMTYSDRTLILRVLYAVKVALVILISLSAAGIHAAALAVTGGAIGFAAGIGLQKIGSNMVAGIMLLLKKPIRQGDVIAFEKSVSGADYGWIDQIGLLYVAVITRNGSLLLIPNEEFVTQKIENLSYDNNRVRLNIPFGIAYTSDLNKAKTLALGTIADIARILKTPEPSCLVREYGDSTVNLELRVWIDDPKNGIANLKDDVLMAVWDSFHANGVEIAFPQRDLHIKSAVPLKIFKDNSQPVVKHSPAEEVEKN
jgi:small-conductance mechanosensitive channel